MSTTFDDPIQGTTAAGFEAVRGELAATAAREGSDYSVQLAVYLDGQLVVDLWTGPEVSGDSLMGVFSASKGASHMVVTLLAQEGELDYEQTVSHYWPEFAAEGKAQLTVRELLAHRSGLIGADEGFTARELADDRVVAQRLGAQRPFWKPGAHFGYHALVMGALSNEVVVRATGRTVQELFAERLGRAHGVDVHLGLTDDLQPQFLTAQPMVATPERVTAVAAGATGPLNLTGIAFNRHHPDNPSLWDLPNLPFVRTPGTLSFGGVASARGLARMYAIAFSTVDGREPLFTDDTLRQLGQTQSIGRDLVTRDLKAFGPGFHLTSEYHTVLGQGTFGHSGVGGQQAFADPRHGLAYAFSRRRSPFPAGAAPENDQLIDAVVAAAEQSRRAG